MKPIRRTSAAWAACLILAACSSGHEQEAEPPSHTALEQLAERNPGLRVQRHESGHVSRLYGTRLGSGATPREAARSFFSRHGAALGVQPDQLEPGRAIDHGSDGGGPEAIPVKYDKRTGRFEFTLLRYAQHVDGLPVYGADIGILVRNEPGNPLVHVSSRTKPVGGFQARLGGARVDRARARAAMRAGAARQRYHRNAEAAVRGALQSFSEAEPVVWAGAEGAPQAPVLAATFIGESQSAGTTSPGKWRFVMDAETGAILHRESLIHFENVTGQVGGSTTLGPVAPQCAGTTSTALAYPEVRISGGTTTFGDIDGTFELTNSSLDPVTVESVLTGRHFRVLDQLSSRNALLSLSVTPPGPADFLHEGEGEFQLAQVNGYVQSEQVRQWLLDIHPEYPTIHSQLDFPVRVNRSDFYCPGNAWYDYSSINFCVAGSGFANTSFASVNHHEYGHHIVATAGSGQGAYGEGMSDTIAMLIADEPGLAYGFYHDQCGLPLRSASNSCQYSATSCSTCGSSVHACGTLLSGAVWSIREQLVQTHPESYSEILSNLVVNSVLLHTGTAIDNQIPIDFLTLDDDDGNLDNGTPHRAQICAGFEAHGLSCPPLKMGLDVQSFDEFVAQGDPGGPFDPATHAYTLQNFGPGALDYTVSVNVPWLTTSASTGNLAEGASTNVDVLLTASALELPEGTYAGIVTFASEGQQVLRTATLRVGGLKRQYFWNMDVDPGWTAQGQWQHGVPLGQGGTYADPTSGYTGSNVYGYNLAGPYAPNMPETHLTTTAIDCSNLSEVTLKFRRWLCVEPSWWDHAYLRVSSDGVNWSTLWENSTTTINDQAWMEQEFDISSVAAGQPTVYVRWTMGTTDGIVQYCGWNIDDVEIWGTGTPPTSCTSHADCDDGVFCNGVEACEDGTCSAGTPVICDDGVTCTVDTCNEALEACSHVPDDGACDNGSFCDGDETCNPITGCQAGIPVDCDDGVACTVDSCDEGAEACAHTPNHAACDNGLYCDGAELCDVSSGCLPGTEPCSGSTCDEATQTCGGGSGCSNHADCNDGDFCNGSETCSAGSCQAGAPWGQPCYEAMPLAKHQASGSFGTTGERWFVVTDNVLGWQASEVTGRTIRVNGVVVTPGQMPLPPRVNGEYYWHFSAGDRPWAAWSFW